MGDLEKKLPKIPKYFLTILDGRPTALIVNNQPTLIGKLYPSTGSDKINVPFG